MDIDQIRQYLRTARDEPDRHGWTPLHRAVVSGNDGDVRTLLLNDGRLLHLSNNDGWTPLHVAAALYGNPIGSNTDVESEILAELLGWGADHNARNKDGWTPLHVAAMRNDYHALIVVGALLVSAHAASFRDARDSKGRTPLHIAAAKNNDLEVIRLLMQHDGAPNEQNNSGCTPLHRAAAKTKNPEIVRLLLDAGADRSLKNGKDQLPFDLANRNKKLRGTEVYWQLRDAT